MDQKYVNWREQRLVGELLADCELIHRRILDVPCGYGRFWSTFSSLGLEPVGLELDRGKMGLRGLLESHRSPQAVCGDAFQLPFARDSFECVFCTRFLHLNHSDSQRLRIMRELYRVSRRLLLMSIYRPTPLHRVARRCNSTPGRVRVMTDGQLSELVQKAGFRLLAVRPLHRFLHMQTFVLLSKEASG